MKTRTWLVEASSAYYRWYPCGYEIHRTKRDAFKEAAAFRKVDKCSKFRVVEYVRKKK
jgi:hypothetical protein